MGCADTSNAGEGPSLPPPPLGERPEALASDRVAVPWAAAVMMAAGGALGSVTEPGTAGSLDVGWNTTLFVVRGALLGVALAVADRALPGRARPWRWGLAAAASGLFPSVELYVLWQWNSFLPANPPALSTAADAVRLASIYGLWATAVGVAARQRKGVWWRIPLGSFIGLPVAAATMWGTVPLMASAGFGPTTLDVVLRKASQAHFWLDLGFLGACYGVALGLCQWHAGKGR